MRMSDRGYEFLKRLEGFRSEAYLDSGGVLTIGYGHVLLRREQFRHVSFERADSLLRQDVAKVESRLPDMVRVPLSQQKVDALICFLFNVGTGPSVENSVTMKLLNTGEYNLFANRLMRWVYDNGKVVQGLVNRRTAEKELFLRGNYGN